MRSVVCFGGLHYDVKARLVERLQPGTSNPVTTTRTVGGVAANVARSLAKLGVPVRLVSVVGDGAGPLLEVVAGDGVDVSGVDALPGKATASYTALLAPDGSLEAGVADMGIYEHMGAGWGLHAASAGDLWFADANIPAAGLEGLRAAAAGRPWFVDPVSVAKSSRIAGVVSGAACVFPDEQEAAALTGRSDPIASAEALVEMGAGHAVVTMGPAGVVHAGPEGVEERPPIPPAQLVDVTGAGDAFAAGYLAAIALDGADPVAWGLVTASLAVATLDTVPSDLGLGAVLALT